MRSFIKIWDILKADLVDMFASFQKGSYWYSNKIMGQ
jgi:hypothetical protein